MTLDKVAQAVRDAVANLQPTLDGFAPLAVRAVVLALADDIHTSTRWVDPQASTQEAAATERLIALIAEARSGG